jgi:branched-chain amino acid transport system substrate-binding protein
MEFPMKRVMATGAVCALLLAACGEGDEAGGDGGGGGDTGPIQLFQIAPIESQVTSLPFIEFGARAAIEAINADGGVNGREMELTVCNDRYDATEAQRCAQEAARGDSVAIVGMLTGHGPQVWPILEQGGLPSIGADAITPADTQSPMSYLIDPGVPAYAGMPGIAADKYGATEIAAVHIDGPSSPTNLEFFEQGAELAGVEIVTNINVPLDALDYAQYVAQVEESGAQAIVSSMSPEANLKMWKALESAGSDLPMVTSAGSVSEQIVQEAGAVTDGDYTIAGTPQAGPGSEAGEQFAADMAEYYPDSPLNGVALRAWASVQLFAEVAGGIDGELTRESLVEALDGVDGMEFLWVDSLSYAEDGPVSEYPRMVVTTVFPSRIEGGVFTAEEPIDPFADA